MTIHLGKIVEYVTFRNSFISGYPPSPVEDVTDVLNNLDQKDYGVAVHCQYLLFFVKKMSTCMYLQYVHQ